MFSSSETNRIEIYNLPGNITRRPYRSVKAIVALSDPTKGDVRICIRKEQLFEIKKQLASVLIS